MTSMTSYGTGLESIPVGFRFRPTDEELISHYLKLKMQGGRDVEVRAIGEVNIYKYEPWDLPGKSEIQSDDQEWFFFCAREIKYPNSKRSNRLTEKGYWKSTGTDRYIKARGTNNVIGTKKTLVYHVGRGQNGVRKPWVIHQYQPVTFNPHEKAFVLCRLIKKPDVSTNEAPRDDGDVSRYAASDFEGQVPGHTIPGIHEFNPEDAYLASLLQSQHQDFTTSLTHCRLKNTIGPNLLLWIPYLLTALNRITTSLMNRQRFSLSIHLSTMNILKTSGNPMIPGHQIHR